MAAALSRKPQTRSLPSVRSGTSTNAKPRTTTSAHQPASLARRLLFPGLPPTSPLPPLFESSAVTTELTEEIYDFLALALRAFVLPWWSKITRYDRAFLPEITRVVTHVLRAVEARLTSTNLAPLVFRDIPFLVRGHVHDFRTARGDEVRFHELQPHMALNREGRIEDEYIRQAVDQVLKMCLPEEDYAPEPERFIIREIVLKVLLQDVVPLLTQPWFLHRIVLDLLGAKGSTPERLRPPESPPAPQAPPFSLHTILVFFLSAIQTISTACLALAHAYTHARSTVRAVNQSPRRSAAAASPQPPPPPISSIPRSNSTASASSDASSLHVPASLPQQPAPPLDVSSTTFHDYPTPLIAMACELITLHDRFASNAALSSVSMLAALFEPFLDRLLPHLLYTHAFAPPTLLQATRSAKRALFPNNGYPAPSRPPDPTPTEQAEIRAALISRLRSLLPQLAVGIILGPDPDAVLSTALDAFSSPPCNARLIVRLLDVLLLTLFPEMGVGGAPSPIATLDDGDAPKPPRPRMVLHEESNREVEVTPPGSMPP